MKDHGSVHFEAEVSWAGRSVIKNGTDIRESRKYSVLWPYHTLADIEAAIDETILFAKKKTASLLKKGDNYHSQDIRIDFNLWYLPCTANIQNKFSLWLYPNRANELVRFGDSSSSGVSRSFELSNKKEWKDFLLAECLAEFDCHDQDLAAYQDKS